MRAFKATLILSLLLLSSCATKKVEDEGYGISVDLEFDNIQKSSIDVHSGIGPQFNEEQVSDNVASLPTGIYFAPSGMGAVSYIGVIKNLSAKKEDYKIASGVGIAAIVAAMYCDNLSTDQMEWFFYKFQRSIDKDHKYLSKGFLKDLRVILAKEFKNKNIAELQKTCFFPVYNDQKKAVEVKTSGKLVDVLIQNMSLYNDYRGAKTAANKKFDLKYIFDKFGSTKNLMVQNNAKEIELRDLSDYLLGTYGKINALNSELKSEFDQVIEIDISGIQIDSPKEFPLLIKKGLSFSET